MSKSKVVFMVIAGFIGGMTSIAAADVVNYVTIDISPLTNNARYFAAVSPSPRGQVVLGGIPFDIDDAGRSWDGAAKAAGTNNTVHVDIPIGVFGASEVHTLINTVWGRPGPYTQLEFFGNDDAYLSVLLTGNIHIRDFVNPGWLSRINGNTSVEVWREQETQYNRNVVMDKQYFALPSTFHDEVLAMIRLTDSGNNTGSERSRAFINGLTIGQVPEPATLTLLGIAGLSAMRRHK